MALTYRTPMEDIVISFEPQTQAVIAQSAAVIYQKLEESNCRYFNYYLTAIAKRKLSCAGIYLSPYSAAVHSHPVCKTLENYILYDVLPHYVNSSYFFVGIKDRKLKLLKSRDRRLEGVQLINRVVTCADKLRYSNELVQYNSLPHEGLEGHRIALEGDTLKRLVGPLLRHKAKHLFLHDELHYWSSDELCTFLEVMQPETMLATLVYPPELLFKQTKSLNEWCYTFEIIRNTFFFYPDGIRSEGYQQPLNGGYLLSTNSIKLQDGTVYGVDILSSKFAHHLVALTRGKAVTSTHRSFGPFEASTASGLSRICPSYPICLPIPCEVISKIYRYLRTLKKPDVQSANAKLSQIVAEPTGREITFVEEFAKFVIKTDSICTTFSFDEMEKFFRAVLGKLPAVFARQFASVRELGLHEFIEGLEPFNFTTKLNVLNQGDIWQNLYKWLEDGSDCEDLPGLCDGTFMFGVKSGLRDRRAQPYHGTIALSVQSCGALLVIPKDKLRNHLIGLYMRERCDGLTRKVSHSAVLAYCTERLAHSILLPKVRRRGCSTTRLSTLEILGVCELTPLIRRIIRYVNCKSRTTFGESGIEWFLLHKTFRARTLFLNSVPDAKRVVNPIAALWGMVVSEVVSSGCRWSHKTEEFCEPAPTRASFIMPPLKVNSVACAKDQLASTSSQMVAYSKVDDDELHIPFICKCGMSMPITDLVLPEHPFDSPDTLRNRRAGWYSRGNISYSYNGGSHQSLGWSNYITTWCEVNGVEGKYDCCLYQVYEAEAAIGFHADDETIFEPGESVLTINLEGRASFGISCAKGDSFRVLNGPLQFTMPMGFQADHKHCVRGCTAGRASLTFRCLKRTQLPQAIEVSATKQSQSGDDSEESDDQKGADYSCPGVKYSEKGLPKDSNYTTGESCPGPNSFWRSLSALTRYNLSEVKRLSLMHIFGDARCDQAIKLYQSTGTILGDSCIAAAAIRLGATITIWNMELELQQIYAPESPRMALHLEYTAGMYKPIFLKNGCVIVAVAEAIGRTNAEVQQVLNDCCCDGLLKEIWRGEGLQRNDMELVFKAFDIEAYVTENDDTRVYNASGTLRKNFKLVNSHLSYESRAKDPCSTLLAGLVDSKCFPVEVLDSLRSKGFTRKYVIDSVRAGMLADTFHKAQTGVLQSELFNKKTNLREHFRESHEVDVTVIVGIFGSGKSHIFKMMLDQARGKVFDFVSPRRALADAFTKLAGVKRGRRDRIKLGQENWRINTFEKFLDRTQFLHEGQVVILDEFQLYPPGYLDLIMSLIKVDVHLFLVGDPAQSDYDCEKDRLALQSLPDVASTVLLNVTYPYNGLSLRFQNRNFLGRLPCNLDESTVTMDEPHELRAGLDVLERLEEHYSALVLVSSFDEKTIVLSYLPKAQVLTFGESTGLTFDYGTILISGISERANERRWYTALSRFRKNICLVNCTSSSYENLVVSYRKRALGKFLSQTANLDDLRVVLPGNPEFRNGFTERTGKDEGVREDKMVGDPWLKTMINLYQGAEMQDEEIAEAIIQESWFKTHIPREELECVRARWVHKILAKEDREVRMGHMISEQFTDDYSKQAGGIRLTNAAERFETIYPRHRANDSVTFIMAVKKRLSFSNPARERAKLFNAQAFGRPLLKEFLKRVPLRPAHNHEFMARALWDFEEKKLGKSAATIENHSGRSCRDWPADVAQIFSKSQLCTKFDNRFRVAKAAQSIVCFQHAVLCRFAPYMRYIEMKVHEALPKNYYIHSGKGLGELNDWVKRGKFQGVCTESDYEAFDASQDEYIMAFELELMRYLRIPGDLIEDYKYIKTSLGSKLGNFAIMRFSGEASTFLFNTLANMLFTFMRYEIKGNEFICFAGDDMCAPTHLQTTGRHKSFLDKLKLKAKVQFTGKPTFCGWHLCPDGIYKKPQLVLERMCIARELNNLANCIDNYAIEVAFAYQLGEKALNRMDEEEVGAFYNCVRIIVRNRHLLKSDVRFIFERGLGD
ncbi:223K [Carlavirus latensaconiti]|uniref:ORF1 protein n=1 Tax=Carlavirus latensaconiti TaxID=101764 RepID=Q91UJ3_9VIRU|nr:polyprotein [Aconitum latent virus]BAB56114.1 223K [Aconitum latent virus]